MSGWGTGGTQLCILAQLRGLFTPGNDSPVACRPPFKSDRRRDFPRPAPYLHPWCGGPWCVWAWGPCASSLLATKCERLQLDTSCIRPWCSSFEARAGMERFASNPRKQPAYPAAKLFSPLMTGGSWVWGGLARPACLLVVGHHLQYNQPTHQPTHSHPGRGGKSFSTLYDRGVMGVGGHARPAYLLHSANAHGWTPPAYAPETHLV